MSLIVLSVLIALFVSFLCSLMEATLLSLTPAQVANLSVRHPIAGAAWQRFKANIERPMAAILVLNTSALAVGGAVAGAQVRRVFPDEGIVFFSLLFTFVMLQLGELLPKTLGVRYNCRLAVVIAPALDLLARLLRPILIIVHWLNRPFEAKRKAQAPAATLEEISALAGLARLSNLIGAHQERIIQGAWRLSHTPVREVMIPVEQVTFISTSQTLFDAILSAHLDPHTRFPICEADDRSRVAGYVNFKEMIYFMRTNPADASLRGIIRPVHFVSPGESAANLLKVFVEQHVHMAIVRDADGRTLGLVTLEDIVECLVGELEDEFDRPPRMFHALSGGTWMVGGGLPAAEFVQRTGVPLTDAQGTMSAWLIRRMGRIPKPGEVQREGATEFLIRRLRRGKIFEVSAGPVGAPHPGIPSLSPAPPPQTTDDVGTPRQLPQ